MKWCPEFLVGQVYDSCEQMSEQAKEVGQLSLLRDEAVSRYQELAKCLLTAWKDHLNLFAQALWDELYCGWDPLPDVVKFHPEHSCSGEGWTQIAFTAANCLVPMVVRLGPCSGLDRAFEAWVGQTCGQPIPPFPLETMLSEETWNLAVNVFKLEVGPPREGDKYSLVAEIGSCVPDKFRLATLLNQLYLISVCPETSVPGGRLPPVEKSNG